jgi:N-methylhydantoinase B/oxoprolinase/acetone carboxylase alpha subunit
MASINDVCPAIVFSGKLERRAGDFVYLQTVAGGAGARAAQDGMDGVHVHVHVIKASTWTRRFRSAAFILGASFMCP